MLCFSFCSSRQQLSAHVCLEEISLPVDRAHCAGSPEGKGKWEGKKAIPDQTDDAETEFRLGRHFWESQIMRDESEWGSVQRGGSLLEQKVDGMAEEALSIDSHQSWVIVPGLNHLRHSQPYLTKLRELLLWITGDQRKQSSYLCVSDMLIHRWQYFAQVCSLSELRGNATGQNLFQIFSLKRLNIPQPNSLFALDLALDLLSLIL